MPMVRVYDIADDVREGKVDLGSLMEALMTQGDKQPSEVVEAIKSMVVNPDLVAVLADCRDKLEDLEERDDPGKDH